MLKPQVGLLCLLLGEMGVAQAGGVVAEHISLGEQYPGRVVATHLRLSNDSDKSVVVKVQAFPDRIVVKHLPVKIPAHGTTDLDLDVHVDKLLGRQVYSTSLDLDSEQKKLSMSVSLFVDSAIDGEPKQVDLGLIAAGKQAEQRVDLGSLDLPDLRARKAQDTSKLTVPEVVEDGRAVVLRTRADAPWGVHEGWVEITTNSDKQPAAWIKYRFETRGRVVPETYELSAGLQRVGKITPQTLFIRDIEGGKLTLGKTSQQGSAMDVVDTDCPVKSPSCRALEVRFGEQNPTGKLFGELTIDLPQYKQSLSVTYSGVLLAPDVKVTNLDDANLASTHDNPPQDLNSALQSATSEKPAPIIAPTPSGNGPLLKWTVQNEQQLYGYVIYRADSENGPMQRINDVIIHALSKQDGVPVEYRWRDTTATLGHTYWYQISTINLHDVHSDLTGRVKKTYTADSATAK